MTLEDRHGWYQRRSSVHKGDITRALRGLTSAMFEIEVNPETEDLIHPIRHFWVEVRRRRDLLMAGADLLPAGSRERELGVDPVLGCPLCERAAYAQQGR